MTQNKTFSFLWLSLGLFVLLIGLGWAIRPQVSAQGPDGPSEPAKVDAEAVERQAYMAEKETAMQNAYRALPAMPATPCVGGMAGPYPCMNTDLMAFMPLSAFSAGSSNDVQGWTDPLDGTEYAVLGLNNGTAFIDISDPENPVYLGKLPGHNGSTSTWRELEVMGDYVYVVSEASGHGMQIFDLTQLRNVINPPVTFTETDHYNAFGSGHTVGGNPATNFMYAMGTNTCSGGLHMINVADPLNAINAGCYSGDGYSHDAQCIVYNGPDTTYQGHEICFDSNEDTMTIVDVTNKASPVMLSRNPYAGDGYTHQTWITDDHTYVLLQDELDEQNFGHNERTRIWDASNLDAPVIIGIHDGPNASIDHNIYLHNGNAYLAAYTSGLQIYSLADVANGNLTMVAHFDSYTPSNSASFNGAWAVYPFFDSGTVLITGIGEGMYIVHPVLSPQFSLTAENSNFSFCEAGSDSRILDVADQNGYTGTVTLSALNLPAGSAASFDPSSVIVPGSSTMTLTVSTTPAGSYPFTILGDDGTLTDTVDATLDVYGAVPGGTTLTSPADGATDVALQPTFTWNAASGAASYFIEIATDASFTNIVDSATVNDTNYTPSVSLASTTTYFWRVTASNLCGDGTVSATFSFTTIDLLCRAPNLAIVDNTTVTDTFVVGNGGTLEDLNVSINANHTWVGDTTFTLTHQDTGTSVTMIDRPGYTGTGFGCSANDIDALLDDEGGDGPVESQCSATPPALFGSPTPNNPLSAFDGEDLSGTWIMSVSDGAGGDTGILNEWCLAPSVINPPTDGTLDGTVTDSDSGDPLVGATLSISGWITETTTDGNGQYSLILPAGSYTVTASATGYLSETVSGVLVTAGVTTTQDFALSMPPTPTEADLSLSKTAAISVTVGQAFTYTLTVNNAGPATAMTVTLTDTLPVGVTFVSASVGCNEASGTVTCSLGDLANGGSAVIEIVVTANITGTLTNTANVGSASPDPDLSDNSATAQTEAVALPPEEGIWLYLPVILKP